jgi:hypothetical protein
MTPVPDQPRASRNRRREGASRLLPRLIAAAALVIMIATAFYLSFRTLGRSPPVQPEYQTAKRQPAPAPETKKPPVRGISQIEEKRPQIQAALRGYYQAASLDEKLAYSRDPDRVRPLMQSYYATYPLKPRNVSGLGSCQSIDEIGHRLGYIETLFATGPSTKVIVEEGVDGKFYVDWESLVKYSEMDWDEFLTRKPTREVLLRVIATQIPSPKADDQEWLELSRPGYEKRLKAYFNRKDPELQPLVEQLQLGSWKNVPLTVRVCYSKSKSNVNAAQIVSSSGKGWLILTDRRS